jgi:hypothetical protein
MLLVHDEHTPTPDTKPKDAYDNFEVMTHTGVPADDAYGAFKGDDRRYYPDMVAYMDKLIGRVTDKLDQLGLRENTLIVLMGDNGTKACFSYTLPDGSEFIGGKGHAKVNGLQVPLVLSMPGTINEDTRYSGLVDVTDIMPTLCDFAGLEIPSAKSIDGISFWSQANGSTATAHREHIYTWYNANRPMAQKDKIIRYAMEIGFKHYAPDANFPNGRFFDLRADPFEQADAYNRRINRGLGIYDSSGLNLASLNAEQQAAYDRLGNVLAEHTFVSVESAKILPTQTRLRVGKVLPLKAVVRPANATIRNTIWESSNPEIASVDKFGQLTALSPGEVDVYLYAWDAVRPLANGKKAALPEGGYAEKISIQIQR